MIDSKTKSAELALGLYFGDVVAPDLPNGRLKGKMKRLSSVIMKMLQDMPGLSRPEVKPAQARVEKFVDAVGWEKKSLSYLTIANFLLALYEDKPYGNRLIPVLNDIYNYFERAGKKYPACEWSAARAADLWEECK